MENIRFICVGDDNDIYWIEADSVIYGITSAGNVLDEGGSFIHDNECPFVMYVDDDNADERLIYDALNDNFQLIVEPGVEPYILFKD